jgi:predicted small secreted protein
MTMLRLLGLLVCALTLSACNTMEGIGKDVKKAGEKIEIAADKVK